MLLTKAYEANQVVTLKTVYGEEIISRIAEETETSYKLNKPMVLISTPQGGFGLAPAVFSIGPTDSVMLNKAAVTLHGPTEKEMASQYLSSTTGIKLASSL